MHFGRCCHCAGLTCFGCSESIGTPSQFEIDFGTTPAYSHSTTGTCTDRLTSFTDGLLADIYDYFDYTIAYEFPSLSGLGGPSTLDLDDAPVNPTCAWASNDFEIYESGFHAASDGSGAGCAGPFSAAAFLVTPSHTGSDGWQYNPYGNPPQYGPGGGSGRTALSTTDSRCGTTVSTGCSPTWSCGFQTYGHYLILRFDSGTPTIQWYWWPRYYIWTETSREIIFPKGGTPTGNGVINGGNANYTSVFSGASGMPSGCPLTLFPSASTQNDISQGIMAEWTGTIDCAKVAAKTAMTFTRSNTPKGAGATQTKIDALGITGIPTNITLTAV